MEFGQHAFRQLVQAVAQEALVPGVRALPFSAFVDLKSSPAYHPLCFLNSADSTVSSSYL